MTVTCATVRRAFGEFECCLDACHTPIEGDTWPGLCCTAIRALRANCVSNEQPPTHPALLKALEEEAK